MKRLIVYFHYDPLGQIDTACRVAVEAMAHYGEVFFISNGTLRPADRAWAASVTLTCRERENKGLDVGAYKEALAVIGRGRLARYDELVLMNFTLAGPVCSLASMFAAMEARPELAFWGLTRHYAMKSRRFGGRSGEVPEHLQSHFLAVRAPLLHSEDFWQYWQKMPLPKSYEESIANHETRFTAHFANLGCRWDSYVDTKDLRDVFVNPIMACPRELLANRGCPFFKRRSFFTPYADELRRTDGTAARTLYDYVKQETNYPVDLLLAALLQRQPLEALAREKNLSGLIPVEQGPAAAFFHRLETGKERYKTFRGELYLEKHQGTYTTQARNKQYNRRMENLLREAEFAAIASGTAYPQAELERIWKEVLLYQFHDILPGSSIKRVYDESLERYAALYKETEALVKSAYGDGNYAINSLSWDREAWIKEQGKWYYVTVPAMGSAELGGGRACKEAAAPADLLENGCVRVRFDESGAVTSVYDLRARREVLSAPSNRLALYYDDGDCWDFNETYRERAPRYFRLVRSEGRTDGPVKKVVQEYVYGKSTIRQTISITEGSPLVTFDTEADWQESQKMLRTAFYTNIETDEVTCDIQYGNIRRPAHRNTSWDMAKCEICAHKYADLSDGGYGAALLNDSKYGYCVENGMLDLNLLRSPNYPGEAADRGRHSFRYALYPHPGDVLHSDVLRKSYEFNQELRIGGRIEQLMTVDNPRIIIESVKKAEDSEAVIVRLYESAGIAGEAALTVRRPVKEAYLVNLMEEEAQTADLTCIPFRGFEIQTIQLILD